MIGISQLALISLGSNASSVWGDATETVQKAMQQVGALGSAPAMISSFYRTPAFPAGAGPDFVNAAMAVLVGYSARDLLAQLHQIEAAAGRERKKRWGQRTLDLDLIGFGDAILPDAETYQTWHDLPLDLQMRDAPKDLILPHPRMHERAFVLVPLCDVAPGWKHPVLGRSVQQMCDGLPPAARAEIIKLGA